MTRYRVILAALIPATICAAAVWRQTNVPQADKIIAEKYATTEAAQRLYDQAVSSADSHYEAACKAADKQRSDRISLARTTAANRLASLGTDLIAQGQLGKALEVYQVAYSFDQRNENVKVALKAAGVDLASIPIDPDGVGLSSGGVQADRLVLWNTHNGKQDTSGARECNVTLLNGDTQVWRSAGVRLDWRSGEDVSTTIALPGMEFTRVRVEVTKWMGYSGGLAEVQVWRNGQNIALRKPALASESADARCEAACVTDGVTSSKTYKQGYWLLPDGRSGWVEVDVARPQVGAAQRYAIFAARKWQGVMRVRRGDILDVSSKGQWKGAKRVSTDANGDGYQFFLQGRVGDQVFHVGARQSIRVGADGVLEMGMNEPSGTYVDNSGFLNVAVTLSHAYAPVADLPPGTTIVKYARKGTESESSTVAQREADAAAANVARPQRRSTARAFGE